MLSFILKGSEQRANDFINKLEIPVHTWSLGGVESLVVRPAQTTHSNFTDEELFEAGIDRRLIRYSVGIESIEDLIEDFKFAIDDWIFRSIFKFMDQLINQLNHFNEQDFPKELVTKSLENKY